MKVISKRRIDVIFFSHRQTQTFYRLRLGWWIVLGILFFSLDLDLDLDLVTILAADLPDEDG